jgi:hypothetical protein
MFTRFSNTAPFCCVCFDALVIFLALQLRVEQVEAELAQSIEHNEKIEENWAHLQKHIIPQELHADIQTQQRCDNFLSDDFLFFRALQ